MLQRWSSILQILKTTVPANTYAMFVEPMNYSEEGQNIAVFEVPTSAFRETMLKAMGKQLQEAMATVWGQIPHVKWVYRDMVTNNAN